MKIQPWLKWLIIGVVIIAIIVTLYFIFRPAPQVAPIASPTTPPAGGLANSLGTILQGIFSSGWLKNLFGGNQMGDPACQTANLGFDNNGFYTRKCGGVPGGGGANCNPDAPGKDMNGFSNSQCGG